MWAIITRTLDDSRCVEPSEGRLECKATSRCAVKSSLDKKCTKVISCCYSHVEWGSYEIPRVNRHAWIDVEATDDEVTAAEISMMIKTAKPRDANISRLQLVVELYYKI